LRKFAEKREEIQAARLGEDSTEELEELGIVRELGNGSFIVETGLGSSVGYRGNWVLIRGDAVSLMDDEGFRKAYEEV